MADSSGAVLVFLKPPVPGRVKTRLIGDLSATQTADLYRGMVEDLLERLLAGPWAVVLCWALGAGESPPPGWPKQGADLPWLRQVDGDLGARLVAALEDADERWSPLAVVGSDHPALDAERVQAAFSALGSGADVAIGPAEDGGYDLIALRRGALNRQIFASIPWSTGSVLATTLARCARCRLTVATLEPGYDVDTPADLERFRHDLASGAVTSPRAAETLASWSAGGA